MSATKKITIASFCGITAFLAATVAWPQIQPAPNAPQPTAPAAAAPTAQQNDTRSRIVARSELVIVPVTVKNHQGALVADLGKDDFRIFEDDVEQQIALFSNEAFPLSAVVLIDDDLSDKNAGQLQKSLSAIAAGFGPNDETALVTYDEFPKTIADFSADNDKLFTQLQRLKLDSHTTMIAADPTTAGPVINGQKLPDGTGVPVHGTGRHKVETALDDAIFSASKMLQTRGRERRKIIFLISGGEDSRNNTHSFDETLRSLLAADVSVYAISMNPSVPVIKPLIQHGASEIEKFATDTGGDTFYAAKQADLERLYSSVTEQARNQYTLSFVPQDIHKNLDYHSIEVRVRRPDLNVFARQGYFQSATNAGR